MKAEAPYPELNSAPAKARRRKQLKAYNVLGDVDEYESMLRAVEEPRTPTPEPPAVFDVSNVPPEVMDAMKLDDTLYEPILGAFHELVAERLALQQEYARVSASQAETAQMFQQQSLALSEDTRDSRILAKHKDYEEKWAIQAVHLASRLGKQPEDVALSRAFKFRKRREKLDHLHKSKPVYERLPGHLYWQVSLRNCHSRFIQVGNEFNGLFTEAKEKPSDLLDVPLEIFGKPKAMDPTRGTTANLLIEALGLRRRRLLRTQEEKGRAWLQGEYLTETLQRYEKLMAKMMAHTPETDELVVIGKSETEALKQRSEAPITLGHVISRLSEKHPEAHTRYEEAASARKQQDKERAAAALQEAEEALQLEQDRSGPAAGPAVRLSATRLVLTATVGYTASAKLTVRAVGTAAFRFYWTRSIQKCTLPGCIMPGEEKTFEFMWKPIREGMVTEAWQLCTFPHCVPGFEPPEVVLRGTGTKHDSDSLLRKRVEQGLSNATSRRESALVIERILRDLTVPPARPQKIPEALMKDHNMFAAAASSGVAAFSSVNGEVSETRRPLFWNEGLGTRLHAAFDQLKELVTPVRQETPPGAKKKGKDKEEPPEFVPAEVLAAVQGWNGSVQELLSLSEQVKDNLSNPELADKATAIVTEINAVITEAELPALRTVITSHAIRCIVERAAVALESAGDSARASAEMAFAQRQVAEGKDPEEEAKKAAEALKATTGKKGKAVIEEKEPEKYDVEEYKTLLDAGFRSALKKSLNEVEPVMEDTVQHVGKLVDGRIKRVQNQLQAAVDKGNSAAEEQKAWELFAWLRKREKFGIREPPADLEVNAAPIRNDPLDFGEKLTIHRPKPAAEHTSSMEPAESPSGDIPNDDGTEPQDNTAANEKEECNYNLSSSKEGGIPANVADDSKPQNIAMDAVLASGEDSSL